MFFNLYAFLLTYLLTYLLTSLLMEGHFLIFDFFEFFLFFWLLASSFSLLASGFWLLAYGLLLVFLGFWWRWACGGFWLLVALAFAGLWILSLLIFIIYLFPARTISAGLPILSQRHGVETLRPPPKPSPDLF